MSSKIKEVEYGVPRYAQTWETFSTEIIDIFHRYLVDKKLTLSDYVENVLEINGIVHSENHLQSPYYAVSSGDTMMNNSLITIPTHNDIIVQGFSQSFIDSDWVEVQKSVQMEQWCSQLANNLDFFASLRVPYGDHKDKKSKIFKVVSLIISALWNNGVNFGDLGGQKARGETSENVPAIHESVSSHLFKLIQKKIRSKRGTNRRDLDQKQFGKKRKTTNIDSFDADSSVPNSDEDKDEDEDEDEIDDERPPFVDQNNKLRQHKAAVKALKEKYVVVRMDSGPRMRVTKERAAILEAEAKQKSKKQAFTIDNLKSPTGSPIKPFQINPKSIPSSAEKAKKGKGKGKK